MTPLIITLLIVYLITNTFVFRFQRTTLSIARALTGWGDANFQILLTPNWIGVLGWTNTGLMVIITILLFAQLGWIPAIVFLLYAFIATAFVDVITPFPSYNQCFKIIEKSLRKDIQKTSDPTKKTVLTRLLSEVLKTKREYKIETK